MKALLPFVFVFSLLSPALAADSAARLGVRSEGEGELTVIATSPGGKVVRATGKGLAVDQPVTADAWTTASVTFQSSQNTTVRLRVSGSWVKEGRVWVLADNVKASGVEIANPDFENDLHKALAPGGWKFLQQEADAAAKTIREPGRAASGKICVEVSHSCPVIQRVFVPKDRAITISYASRLANSAPKDPAN